MMTFFATFGCGSPFRHKFVGIVADSKELAEYAMRTIFVNRWAYVYPVTSIANPESDLSAQAQCHGITALCHFRVTAVHRYTDPEVQLIGENEFSQEISEPVPIKRDVFDSRLIANEVTEPA